MSHQYQCPEFDSFRDCVYIAFQEGCMKIITLGEALLRKKSVLVSDWDQGIENFVQAMFDTMRQGKGIGLAAVQVGQLLRLFVTHVQGDEPRVFMNPDILETSIETGSYEEGCLSVPGLESDVIRPLSVRLQAFNESGRPFSYTAEGLLARVIQHEMDHLNGKLFIDHLNPKKRERLLKGYDQKVHV